MMKEDKKLIVFAEEKNKPSSVNQQEPWVVLIVDDEPDIHRVTQFIFKNFTYAARSIVFLNAYSAQEAKEILNCHDNIACIFLDVVMETDDAGLQLVGFIRNELNNHEVRIILRTGQPGYAPKLEVIQGYDISDYKEKAELTNDVFFICLTAALRCYQQIQTIESSRKGLSMIIDVSSNLLGVKAVTQFSAGMLTQICGLLNMKAEGVVCIHGHTENLSALTVLAAAGSYINFIGKSLDTLEQPNISNSVLKVLASKKSCYEGNINYVYIPLSSIEEIVVFINSPSPISSLDQKLLEIFSINIAVGFENAKMFEKIESLAYQDQLTHLPNKLVLLQEINKKIQQQTQNFFLILVDVDNFEEVNDGLGYEIGDKLIIQVAHILVSLPFEQQFIAHLGGDLFALIIPVKEHRESANIMKILQDSFDSPITLADNLVPVSISIGGSYFDGKEFDADALLRTAGIALKHAKQQRNGNYCLFERSMNIALQERLRTIKDIHHAMDNNEFRLFYQPQVCIRTGRIVGVEALIRWQRADGSLMNPLQFISAAETSGLIVPIGGWVLETAINQHFAWKMAGYGYIRMAVNVSPRQLCELDYVDKVKKMVASSGIDVANLELEITENMAMTDPDEHIEKLIQLREAGIKIAVDDFGTGYSSLSYLQKLPIDRLKIDGAFVRNIDTKKEDASIAAMIINMGHELNLHIIAECVETTEHLDILNELGCDEAQGYLYSKPLPADELSKFFSALKSNQTEGGNLKIS